MLIANAIYDSVFKYLMEDNPVVRLLLGAEIGKDIISLEPRPHLHKTGQSTSGICKLKFYVSDDFAGSRTRVRATKISTVPTSPPAAIFSPKRKYDKIAPETGCR